MNETCRRFGGPAQGAEHDGKGQRESCSVASVTQLKGRRTTRRSHAGQAEPPAE